MKKISKLVVLMLILTLSITALCACGGNGDNKAETTPDYQATVKKYTDATYEVESINVANETDKNQIASMNKNFKEQLKIDVEIEWMIYGSKNSDNSYAMAQVVCFKTAEQAKAFKKANEAYAEDAKKEGATVVLKTQGNAVIVEMTETIPETQVEQAA